MLTIGDGPVFVLIATGVDRVGPLCLARSLTVHLRNPMLDGQHALISRMQVVELASVEAPGPPPEAEAITDQHLHAVAPAVAKQIIMVRWGGTEDLDHTAEGLV